MRRAGIEGIAGLRELLRGSSEGLLLEEDLLQLPLCYRSWFACSWQSMSVGKKFKTYELFIVIVRSQRWGEGSRRSPLSGVPSLLNSVTNRHLHQSLHNSNDNSPYHSERYGQVLVVTMMSNHLAFSLPKVGARAIHDFSHLQYTGERLLDAAFHEHLCVICNFLYSVFKQNYNWYFLVGDSCVYMHLASCSPVVSLRHHIFAIGACQNGQKTRCNCGRFYCSNLIRAFRIDCRYSCFPSLMTPCHNLALARQRPTINGKPSIDKHEPMLVSGRLFGLQRRHTITNEPASLVTS